MKEKEFKGFLRMLDKEFLSELIIYGWCGSIDLEIPTEFENKVIMSLDNNIKHNKDMDSKNNQYETWLTEVKKERGL